MRLGHLAIYGVLLVLEYALLAIVVAEEWIGWMRYDTTLR